LELSVADDQEKINKNKEISQEIGVNILEVEKELSRINSEEQPSNIKKINQDLRSLSKKIEAISDYQDSENISKIIKEIKASIKELLNFSSGENYNYQIEKINNKLADLKKEKNKIDEETYNLQIKYNSERNKKEGLERDLSKIEKEIEEIESKIKINEEESSDVDITPQKKVLEADISKLSQKIIKTREEKNALRSQIELWREEKSQQQEILQKSQNKLNEINNRINLFKNDSLKIQSKIEGLWEEIKEQSFLGSDKIENAKNIEEENSFIDEVLLKIEKDLPILQEKINNFNQAQEDKKRRLLDLQKSINETENNLSRITNELNNNKIELTREETRTEDLINNILEDKLDLEKIKKHKVEEEFRIDLLKQEIGQIKSQLELIGGIDPETEKEYEETKKRYDFLSEQTEDLNNTIKSLEKVIMELDIVIKDRFEVEFKVISEKFNEYFKILFSGGNAKIFPIHDNVNGEEEKNGATNENGEKILEAQGSQSSKNIKLIRHLKKHNALGFSGVDISATPPGKKIASVNMLSGGERALTAIALICAIISANPAPFVVLDEVDAALDEANSERLAKILDDLSNKTQFIAISHNRATMKRANILYGVTMQNDGVSKLLSVKLDSEV
jgi:chromosome segregation protein